MPKRSKNLFLWDVTPIVGERMVPGLSLDKRISVPPGASYDAQAIFIEEKCSVWHPDSISYVETNSELIYGINEYSKGEKSSITVIQEATDSFVVIEKQTLSGKTIIFQLSANGTTAGAVVDDKGNFNAMEPFKSSDFPYHTAAFLLAILLIASTIMPEVKRDPTFVTSVLKNGDKAAPYASHRDNALYRLNDAVFFGLKDGFIDCVLTDSKNSVTFLPKSMVKNICKGTVLCGSIDIPGLEKSDADFFPTSFAKAKENYQDWVDQEGKSWTEEEEALIPTFPEDYQCHQKRSISADVIRHLITIAAQC